MSNKNDCLITIAAGTNLLRLYYSKNGKEITSYMYEQKDEAKMFSDILCVAKATKDYHDFDNVRIRFRGTRQSINIAIDAIKKAGINIIALYDTNPIPHNGCRPKRKLNQGKISEE